MNKFILFIEALLLCMLCACNDSTQDARQQHLLFRKNNIKQNLRIEGSLKHHFLFTETPILCLINQSKGSFT